MNPMELLQLKSHFDTFKNNHPKFLQFINVVAAKGIPEGSVIEITVETPDGEKYNANMRVLQSDLELIQKLKNLQK